jgi:hypothetical protein
VGFVEGETGYCSETCVAGDVDGTGEFSIDVEVAIDIKEEFNTNVEEAIEIKEEMPEATSHPPIKTEPEVRLQVMCKVVAAVALGHLLPPKKKI